MAASCKLLTHPPISLSIYFFQKLTLRQIIRDTLSQNHPSQLPKTAPPTVSNSTLNLTHPPSRIPIATAVPRIQSSYTEDTLEQLSDTFQQLEIDKGTSTSHTPISEGESIPYSIATMNDNTLSQTFTGVGYKPIYIKIYIQSIEKIIEYMRKNK